MNEALKHERYEELCALAALGQIPAEDFAELSNHIGGCGACQTAYASFSQVLHAQFSQGEMQQTSTKKLPDFFLRRNKHLKLFLSRAKELGFQFSEEAEPQRPFWGKLAGVSLPSVPYKYASVVIIIALILMVGVLGHRWQESAVANATKSAELAKFGNENNSLRQQVAVLQQKENSLTTQLSTTRSEKFTLAARHNQLEAELHQASLALQSLQVELEATRDISSARDSRLQETGRVLGSMAAELRSLQEARSKDASLLAVQQLQLQDLSQRLREQAEVLGRERRLLVADRDIRELMGARNLHIYDVIDVDSRGKNKTSFGRLFYTEGKSLIFYAFDLNRPNLTNAKHSFQAWGQREGRSGSAVSLGIFYIDNAEQRRWILKSEDPEALRHINAVFVTVEPFGGGERPTGDKLLYAYLNNKPNHP